MKLGSTFSVTLLGLALSVASASNLLSHSSPFGSSVKQLSTAQLVSMLSQERRQRGLSEIADESSFVLVDVRESSEMSVSMIPGAISKTQYEANRSSYVGKTVIAYCTVGWRSQRYAKQLQSSGVDAINYLDSIVGWCDAQQPLVTPDGRPTMSVHTYSGKFNVPENYAAVW